MVPSTPTILKTHTGRVQSASLAQYESSFTRLLLSIEVFGQTKDPHEG